MTVRRSAPSQAALPRRGRGAEIRLSEIQQFAHQVARRFHPDKIILFGSYAYGTPHPDSDVDLLVVMPARNELDQAFRIRLAMPAPFPMDLIVRTPEKLKKWLEMGDSFHSMLVSQGRVLYEKTDTGVGAQS
jgi:predicted nucleotidyltransferase